MTKTLTLVSTTAAALLIGCSSSSDSSSATLSGSPEGTVADGYLIGATVCIDENINLACDDGEPATTTDENGYYIFTGVTDTDYPIVVEVTADTIDSDTNKTVDEAYVLSTPNTRGGFISPLTTLIHEYYLANADNNITTEDAREAIAAALDLNNTDLLFMDYMAPVRDANMTEEERAATRELHEELHAIAKLLVYTKLEIRTLVTESLIAGGDLNTSAIADRNDTLNIACHRPLMESLEGIKEDARGMDWRDEDAFRERGQHRGAEVDANATDVTTLVGDVSRFDRGRGHHHNLDNNGTVSGQVGTGSITE